MICFEPGIAAIKCGHRTAVNHLENQDYSIQFYLSSSKTQEQTPQALYYKVKYLQ